MAEILVDSNEAFKNPNLVRELRNKNTPVKVQHLDVGDIQIGNLFIERKRAVDFVSSLRDNRIWKLPLAVQQTEGAKGIILVTSGDFWREIVRSKHVHEFLYNQVLGAKTNLAAKWNNISMFEIGEDEFADYILSLHRQLTKEGSIRTVALTSMKKSVEDRRVDALTCIEGISVKKGSILMNRFRTIANLGVAETNDITDIEGFGKKLADRIIEFFRNE